MLAGKRSSDLNLIFLTDFSQNILSQVIAHNSREKFIDDSQNLVQYAHLRCFSRFGTICTI